MSTVVEDPTLPPRYVVEYFRKAYHSVHHREPNVRYVGNHWYHVNGETVHRSTLIEEIVRLRSMPQERVPVKKTDSNLIQKLISKLRAL